VMLMVFVFLFFKLIFILNTRVSCKKILTVTIVDNISKSLKEFSENF